MSGIAIITKGVPFNRRNRFVLTAGLAIGYGATLVSNYFSNVFTYSGDNHALQGFLDAIVLIMETGFAVTAIVCMVLNLTIPEEIEEIEESASDHSAIAGWDSTRSSRPTDGNGDYPTEQNHGGGEIREKRL